MPRSGGTCTTLPPSAAGDRPPTTTSSPRPLVNWSERLRSTGSLRATAGARKRRRVLESELKNNTFPSGVNREMAFDYHGFVTELAVVAAAEASCAGRPLSTDLWASLYRMFDVVAATVDVRLRAPRQGDGDNGTALVLDPPAAERWSGLLAIGAAAVRRPGLVAHGGANGNQHFPGVDGRTSCLGALGPSPEPLRRCRHDPAAEFTLGRRRDLVPM